MKISKQKLQQIIKEEIQKLRESTLPKHIQIRLNDLYEVLPGMQKICELVPFECNADIYYYYGDVDVSKTYEEAVAHCRNENITFCYEEKDICPSLFIVFENKMPTIDDAFMSFSPGALGGVFFTTGDEIRRDVIINQMWRISYDELDDIIKKNVDVVLETKNVKLKDDLDVDVDLDLN